MFHGLEEDAFLNQHMPLLVFVEAGGRVLKKEFDFLFETSNQRSPINGVPAERHRSRRTGCV